MNGISEPDAPVVQEPAKFETDPRQARDQDHERRAELRIAEPDGRNEIDGVRPPVG